MNAMLQRKVKTKNVGPFSATGFEIFLDVLITGFRDLKTQVPDV